MDTPDARPEITSSAFGADHDWLSSLAEASLHAWERGDAELSARLFSKLERRLRQHMRVEEDMLYAAVERRVPSRALELDGLRDEHEDLHARLDRISSLLASAAPRSGAELGGLRDALRDHERREEATLFPLCDRTMDPAVRSAAVRELDRRLWGPVRP
jgi:iron-sulfur cluster repair protein YtfE (RIC family)